MKDEMRNIKRKYIGRHIGAHVATAKVNI